MLTAQKARVQSEKIIERYCQTLPEDIGRVTDMLETGRDGAKAYQTVLGQLHDEIHRMAGAA